jgi:DNA-nicking Smr family endonuclease|tara:strand:+ start:8199 stop:8657 length:459 start_codon:yes stop_codon:yes gene_type:complete
MEDEDDLSVWNEFINNEFEVENKDTFINDNYLNKSSREVSFKKKKGLPPPGTLTKKIVKKLATKKIETSATLDLHGLNIEDARVSFLSFLDTCWKYKYSYVLIITGKGKGILKNAFIEWLKEDEIFPLIIGYSIAHRLQGGDGAFVLHLRKR